MRCTARLRLMDPAALGSRTPPAEAIKAEVQCTLPADHQTNHAAMISDTKPTGAVIVWHQDA